MYHGQRDAVVPGLDGKTPGFLQFEFQWFFSSHGSGRGLNSLGEVGGEEQAAVHDGHIRWGC